jgi:hypothetical protein
MKNFASLPIVAAVLAAVVCLTLCALGLEPVSAFGAGLLGLGMAFAVKDASLKGTRALPAAASSTVDGAAIDLKHGSFGDFLADAELKLTAPAVNTTMAPDTRTFTYSIIHSDNSDLSSPTVLYSAVITQTGAGGAGAATTSATVRLPVDVKRYVGARVVSGASTADASSVTATLELLT